MQSLRLVISPLSAIGTPLSGDTLFGCFCCALAECCGEERLKQCLTGYKDGNPFAVVASAAPHGFLQRPQLPARFFAEVTDPALRKRVKKALWLSYTDFMSPIRNWMGKVVSVRMDVSDGRPHNTINRLTATTGVDIFAPRNEVVSWYGNAAEIDIVMLLDDTRLSVTEARRCWEIIGHYGYGRDASTGLGKFAVKSLEPFTLPQQQDSNSYLTLGPCAPQRQKWRADACFYKTLVRFGRHGAHFAARGMPFKNPVLLAETAAVFTPEQFRECQFVGQGLDGVSPAHPQTVQQGYAPVIGIHLPVSGEI